MFSKVKFEIISGLYCDFLNFLVEKEYCISSVEKTDFGVTAICYGRDYKSIARQAKLFQCRTKILKREGAYYKVRNILKRKGAICGVAMVFLCVFLFSNIIWRVDVISPDESLKKDVYSLLYTNDVCAGSIFSENINKAVRQKIFMDVENVGYVTLNFHKGILTCKIDPAISPPSYLKNQTDGNITATESGVIDDLRVYSGFSKVTAGQSVYKGDILVSPTYVDRNGTIQQVMPRAYIKALCQKEYTAQLDFDKEIYLRTGEAEKQSVIKFLGFNIVTQKADTDGWSNYDVERMFYPLTVLNFRFPVTVEATNYYNKEKVHITRDAKTTCLAAEKVIDTMIQNDFSLISEENRYYNYLVEENGMTVVCTVVGYYDITK